MPVSIFHEEVQRLLDEEDAQLVEGAINIPLKRLDDETTAELDRARPVIVYCHDAQ